MISNKEKKKETIKRIIKYKNQKWFFECITGIWRKLKSNIKKAGDETNRVLL